MGYEALLVTCSPWVSLTSLSRRTREAVRVAWREFHLVEGRERKGVPVDVRLGPAVAVTRAS